jgi:hypothetical protein
MINGTLNIAHEPCSLGSGMVNRVLAFSRIAQSLNWMGMADRWMLRFTVCAIALITADRRQCMHEVLPARVTLCR